jgi:hypothetical protein
MNCTSKKSTVIARQDIRCPQLTEFSMLYEGHTEDISVRPPDLSPHGMFVNTHSVYPQGAILKLRFRLARTGVLIQTRSEVRYCLSGVGVGVEFIDLPADSVEAIQKEISLQSSSEASS